MYQDRLSWSVILSQLALWFLVCAPQRSVGTSIRLSFLMYVFVLQVQERSVTKCAAFNKDSTEARCNLPSTMAANLNVGTHT